jgi:acetyl esterase/lipase
LQPAHQWNKSRSILAMDSSAVSANIDAPAQVSSKGSPLERSWFKSFCGHAGLAAIAMSGGPALAQYTPANPTVVSIWPEGASGSEARRGEPEVAKDYWVRNVQNPSLTIFRPAQQNGAAVIVIPGGAHKLIVWTTEGVNFGRALNRYGLTTFVLKYRLAHDEGSTATIDDEVSDVRRAIRWVRAHAQEYGVDPHRIGIMGFSAGGELVTLVADNAVTRQAPPKDSVDRLSDRPDFQVLVFPGPLGVPANDTAHAPPAFITAGSLDTCCAAPAVALYEQLRAARRPAELHMYAGAGHAFNLDESSRISIIHWPDRLADWLADEGFMAGSKQSGSSRQ